MKNIISKLVALLIFSSGVLSVSVYAQSTTPFDSVSYTYTEGAFAGGQYRLSFPDGKVKWEGLAGDEKGLSGVEETSEVVSLGNSSYMVTWLESNGLTVTAVLNTKDNTINAVASTSGEHYVLRGKIDNVK